MPDILLKDKDGVDVTYEGVETVTFDTPTQEKGATFTYGEVVELDPIALDLAEGNLTVSVSDAELLKQVTIVKPDSMTPENIRNGINIGGVVGTLEVLESQVVEVDLTLADGDQVLTAPDGYAYSQVTVKKPSTLIPRNILEGVEIAGVVGEMTAGSGDGFDFSADPLSYTSYSVDSSTSTVFLCSLLYDVLFNSTGSYDVTIPDTVNDYSICIRCV